MSERSERSKWLRKIHLDLLNKAVKWQTFCSSLCLEENSHSSSLSPGLSGPKVLRLNAGIGAIFYLCHSVTEGWNYYYFYFRLQQKIVHVSNSDFYRKLQQKIITVKPIEGLALICYLYGRQLCHRRELNTQLNTFTNVFFLKSKWAIMYEFWLPAYKREHWVINVVITQENLVSIVVLHDCLQSPAVFYLDKGDARGNM